MMTRISVLALAVALAACVPTAADLEYWLDDVPDYSWYHGCAPTAGGMAIGYWDNQPDYGDLHHGTAPLYANDATSPLEDIYHAIASHEHISSGYDREACTHDSAPNSIACFMHADPQSPGAVSEWNVPTGMQRYAAWDNPLTPTNESYAFGSVLYYTPRTTWQSWRNDAAMSFEVLQYEIDQGRPVLLGLSLDGGFGGHEVLAYGYRRDAQGNEWFAVRDTWQDGDSNGDFGIASEMHDGQEWWRWDLHDGQAFGSGYYVASATPFVPDEDGSVDEAVSGDIGDNFAEAWRVQGTTETIYGTLTAGDQDWYRVWLEEGEQFVAMTQDDEGYTETIDTLIALYDPDQQYVRHSDSTFGIPGTTLMWWEADSPGWWSFSVQSGGIEGEGKYYLDTYCRTHNPEPGTILLVSLGVAGLLLRRRGAAPDRGE